MSHLIGLNWLPSFMVLLFQKVRDVKQLPVELKPLMDGLTSLLMPSQKVMFSQHMYVLWLLPVSIYLVSFYFPFRQGLLMGFV